MQYRLFLPVAIAVSSATRALGQDAASTSTAGLDHFLGIANSAVSVINSANAKATAIAGSASSSPATASASPTSQAPATSSSAAAGKHPSHSTRNLIIAVVCAVVGALLIAILLGICCCLMRRRRRHRKEQRAMDDEREKTDLNATAAQPLNPGRTYTPLNQHGHTSNMEQSPTFPRMAVAATPNTQQHPAHRDQNPFVPMPPSPRKGAYSSGGLTDTTAHDPYVAGLRNSHNTTNTLTPNANSGQHNSYSTTGPHDSYATAPLMSETHPLQSPMQNSRPSSTALPVTPSADRPSTPFGLSGIGKPYEDMHVHVLQTESPSRELLQSTHAHDPVPRYHTPPLVPSRSPHRRSAAFADSYQSSTNTSTSATNSGSGEDWHRAQGTLPPWEQRQNRYSDSSTGAGLPTPPVPWDDDRYTKRRSSRSPRTSMSNADRQTSGSPARSLNGQSRRLRFSDVQSGHARENEVWDGREHTHGVGEAL